MFCFWVFKKDFVLYTGNKGEKKQKINDLVIRSWREDRRVVSLLVGLHIHISIATDMKMKEKSGHAETASLFSVFRKYNVYIIMIIYLYFSIRLIILAKCFLWTIDPLACKLMSIPHNEMLELCFLINDNGFVLSFSRLGEFIHLELSRGQVGYFCSQNHRS